MEKGLQPNLHEPLGGFGEHCTQCKTCKFAYRGLHRTGYKNAYCYEYPEFSGMDKPTEVLDNEDDGCVLFEEGFPSYIGPTVSKAQYSENMGKWCQKYFERFGKEFPVRKFWPDKDFKDSIETIKICLTAGKTVFELGLATKD